MGENAKFWIQVAGALFFVGIALSEALGLKSRTFGFDMGWIIFALAAATMAFEAWRTRRKMKTETNDN